MHIFLMNSAKVDAPASDFDAIDNQDIEYLTNGTFNHWSLVKSASSEFAH